MIRPTTKDKEASKYIDHLELVIKKFEESPYLKTYLTLRSQIESFNEQLTLGKTVTVTIDGKDVKVDPAFVDLFADKDDKSFDRTKWYFDNMLDLNKQMDDLRALMTPEEQRALKEKEKMEHAGLAERMALRHKAEGK